MSPTRILWLTAMLLVALVPAVCLAQPGDVPVRDYSLHEATQLIREHKGSVVVFHLYTSWCEPCQAEIATLIRVRERYRSHPFQLLAFSVDKNPEMLRGFLKEAKINFPPRRIVPAKGEDAATIFRDAGMTYSSVIPFAAVFDPSGKLVKEWTGGKNYAGYISILDSIYLNAGESR